MGLNNLLEHLGQWLERDKKEGGGDEAKLDELLRKLCAKKRKLKQKIADEEDKSRRKRLKLRLRLLRAELKRGLRRRRELRDNRAD